MISFSKECLALAVEAARLAGRVQMDCLRRKHHVRLKGVSNLVTEVDLKCERMIIAHIRKRFPRHSFLAEEGGQSRPGSEFLWIIDPLDGTTNYAHGFLRFCVSIALAQSGGVLAGAVYNPVADELFTARSKYLVVELNWDGQLVREVQRATPKDSRVHFLGICGDLPTNQDLIETFEKILKNEPLSRRGWELEAW
jgi:fructose-1,6-bisphosphatase/inositol monophosphatase family enzyme